MDEYVARAGTLLRRAYGPLAEARVWRALLYHALDLPVAWLAAVFVFATGALSGLLLPVAPLTIAAALTALRFAARFERARARVLLGVDVTAPPAPDLKPGLWGWIRGTVSDALAWRAAGYLVVRFVLGNAAFLAVLVTVWATGALLTAPLWSNPGGARLQYAGGEQIADAWWELLLAVLLGLVLAALAPRIVLALGRASGWAVRTLLGPATEARIRQLETQRSTAVRAADVDRRRIEQDLHDGAQVRLTALAMQLGRAREALSEGADTARVAELVEDAHAQAKLALKEIRDLARGIHPAILTDRGLDAALTSMVGRLPIPVDLVVAVAERPSPEVESIVYFVAAEAVTNAVRHADSPGVGLRVVREDSRMLIEVRDRGRGGADFSLGTGLANLRERVEATGGEMTVQSPEGVGTLVRAVVPCGS